MPDLLLSSLILLGGIALLLGGGELLVRGAVTMAVRLNVAPLVIGLTVVAFGTSAPELALNVIAALQGNDGLSFGNIIGSNIANIGLILGVAALIQPMSVHDSVIRRELPLMLAMTVLASVLALHPWPEPWNARGEGLDRVDGSILAVAFTAFLYYTLRAALKKRTDAPTFIKDVTHFSETDKRRPLALAVFFFVFGLGLLLAGGKLAEEGASEIARLIGWGDELIGLTVVAIATSLPELATSVIAARRGHADIAVGNVMGSNIFNLTLVLGATALVNPVDLPERGAESIFLMVVLSLLLIPMTRTHGRILSRFEGFILLLLYAGYMAYEVAGAVSGLD